MKQIKFNNTLYTLACDEFCDAANLRVAIFKENHTIPEVANIVNNVETIYIIDGEEILAQYVGFTKLISLSSCEQYPLQYGSGSSPLGSAIIIELQNNNIQQQINNLTSNQINIKTDVSNLDETVNELVDSQATQDLAIEDLAETVSELEGE